MPTEAEALELERVSCAVCGRVAGEPVGVGEDFEYRTSADTFLAVECPDCSLVYLDPRPTEETLGRIYPDHYHAFQFTAEDFGLAFRVRSRLEARRLLKTCGDLPDNARILDAGCGDGFHLDLLRNYGNSRWTLRGVDLDPRAAAAAQARGLDVEQGTLESLDRSPPGYDLVLLIATIEHVADPASVLTAARRQLRPGGRVLIVTDNTGSVDYRLSRSRHWGGYHFPRHWNLFNESSLRRLAGRVDLEVADLRTMVSPVNWTYSVRNALDDFGAPRWLVNQFTLSSPIALAFFTLFDMIHTAAGRGALLRAVLRRPE